MCAREGTSLLCYLPLIGFKPTDQSQTTANGWMVALAHLPSQINHIRFAMAVVEGNYDA